MHNLHHFLDISQLPLEALHTILTLAAGQKRALKQQKDILTLEGKHLAMLFEKPSTRTRISFEVGIRQLGGHAVLMDSQNSQLGRGEKIAGTARVLSRYVDLIMLRCYSHETLLELAQYATVPVINGLTDLTHPCQVMADIMTFEEHRGSIQGKKVAWVGDGNNMCHSWIEAAAKFKFTLHIATPREFAPHTEFINRALQEGGNIILTHHPKEAADGADIVTTDTWVSMGDTDIDHRHETLAPFQVNKALMHLAKKDALFMHCLPAHREEEVTAEIMDGEQSVVWDEAENRLHIQKAIMLWCMGKER